MMLSLKENEAMTKWWLKITIQCYLWSLIQIDFVKGVCAVSGCCVCIGYYVFACIYNSCYQPNLTKQFYINNFAKTMSYQNYVILDVLIHIILPVLTYVMWYKHVTIASSIIAYLFHRSWSIVNSNYTSIYLDGSSIYKINNLPVWGWTVVYIGEFIVLVISTLFALYNK